MIQVEESRLAELLREERKLRVLERSGIDNWDWFDVSLFPEDDKTLDGIENMSDEDIIKNYL